MVFSQQGLNSEFSEQDTLFNFMTQRQYLRYNAYDMVNILSTRPMSNLLSLPTVMRQSCIIGFDEYIIDLRLRDLFLLRFEMNEC